MSNRVYRNGRSTRMTMRGRRAITGYLFILPFIIGFVVFMIRPMVQSLQMSLSSVAVNNSSAGGMDIKLLGDYAGVSSLFTGDFWGKLFTNFNYALRTDPYFNQYLVDEVTRMLTNTLATLVISFVVAVILNQEFKGRTLARAIFFLPVILSSGLLPGIEQVNGLASFMMEGVSDELAKASGVNISQALQDLLSVSGVGSKFFSTLFEMIDAIYDIVMASGIQIIVFLGGLQSVPRSLYEAADVEGCTAWESFWKITFPMVSPLLLVNCIYTIIDFFMKTDNTVMERINTVMYSQMRFAEASAMSWIYFGVAVVFIAISSIIISKGVHYYE